MFKEAKEIIDKSNNIYISAHVNPDGDAIGSTIAICFALKKLGKNAKVVMSSYSTVFEFLPGVSSCVKSIDDSEFDLLIALDSSDNTRLAITQDEYNRAKKVIMLDHHQISSPYGDFRFIDDKKSSASEIAYLFIKSLDVEIDKDMATLLYTGIMTDTGSFNYSNANSDTFRVVAELLDYGAEAVKVCKKLNDTMKESKLKLIAKTIDNMEVFYNGKMRYSFVPYDEIRSLGIDDEDAEGMTNYLRAVEGTEVAVYVRGKSDGTNKVSMRSGGNVDISKIAIEFGGGGHPRAAGYTMREDEETEKQKLIKVVGEML